MSDLAISEIQIIPIRPLNGLVAFASCVLNSQFYVGNIAIYTCPSASSSFRLVFPNKKLVSGKVVDCFHPITPAAGRAVSDAITKAYIELMDNFHNIEVV